MGKSLKYVKDFQFPCEAGFSGSGGKTMVKGYARGGSAKMTPAATAKVGKVMGEYKSGALHSGSKTGPLVDNKKQALAIAMSEARAAGKKK